VEPKPQPQAEVECDNCAEAGEPGAVPRSQNDVDEQFDPRKLIGVALFLAYGFAAGWAMAKTKTDIYAIRIDGLQRRVDRLEAYVQARRDAER
jgi:hypothetical protein